MVPYSWNYKLETKGMDMLILSKHFKGQVTLKLCNLKSSKKNGMLTGQKWRLRSDTTLQMSSE